MIVIILLSVSGALLGVGGLFALMSKDNMRLGQSGTPHAVGGAKQGRVPGLD